MSSDPTPPPRRKGDARGLEAGMMLLSAIVVCTALGAGAGALIGATAPLLLIGLFAGFVVGIVTVARRFRDL